MKVCLLQTDIQWQNTQENIRQAQTLMDAQPGADLYVLPEMWNTGFITSPSEQEQIGSAAALAWMERTAREKACHIIGSVATRIEGRFRNRLYVFGPQGEVGHYDKRHLFGYGGEHLHYESGSRRVIVECQGVRILLQVCYDLRFPVFSRNRGDYDMAIYVASWPDSRQRVWDTLLRARAIENQCYVCGVNRVGSDPACQYTGGSALIDAYGRTVLDLGTQQGAQMAEIDLAKLNSFREKFAVLNDADSFELTF